MRRLTFFILVAVMIFAGCAKRAQEPVPPIDGFSISGYYKPSYWSVLDFGHPMTRGLELMWLLNDRASVGLFDMTRNGNTGTISGATWIGGDRGPCLSFDGTDDYLEVARISGMSNWSAYIRYCPTDVSNAYALLDQGDIVITQNSDDIVWGFTDSGNSDVTSTASAVLSSGTWVDVLATKSGSEHTLYIDGISIDTLSDGSTPLTSETYLRAGRRTGTGISYVAMTPSNLTSEQAVGGMLEYSRGSADMSGTIYENAPGPRQGTIEMWTKPYFASTDTDTRYLLDASSAVLYWNGSATQWKATVNGVSITASDTFSANTWIHIVLRWETEGTDSLDLAVDGTDETTVTTSQTIGTPSATIYGHKDNGGSNTYSGASTFRWLNRKIADADIDTLYASGNGNLDSFDTGMDVVACGNFTDSDTSIRYAHRGKTVSAIADGSTEDTLTTHEGSDNSFADNDEVLIYDGTGYDIGAQTLADGTISDTSFAVDDGAGADAGAIEDVGVFADLDGDSQYFYATDANFPESGITGANDLTIWAWVKPDLGAGNTGVIFAKWESSDNKKMYALCKTGDELLFYLSDDGSTSYSKQTSSFNMAIASSWTHIAAVYDASAGTLDTYKNGAFIEQETGLPTSIADKDPSSYVGQLNNTWYFNGAIFNVALFGDKRTPAEILASATDPRLDVSGDANCIGQWMFDDAAAATAIDNLQGDAGRDLIPYDGGDVAYSACGRTQSAFVTKNLTVNPGFESANMGGLPVLTPSTHTYATLSSITDGVLEDNFTASASESPLYHLFADNQRIVVFDDTGYRLDAVGDGSPTSNTWAADDGAGADVGALEDVGVCADLDGSSQYFERAGDDNAFDPGLNDIIYSAWFNNDLGSIALGEIINKYHWGWRLYVNNGTVNGYLSALGTDDILLSSSVATYNDGKWHHALVTWDRSSATGAKLFIDGALHDTDDATVPGNVNNSWPLAIGRRSGSDSRHFPGKLSDIRVWIAADLFSGETVAANALTLATGPLSASMDWNGNTELGWWKLIDTDMSSTVVDSSGNGYDLTTSGSDPRVQEAYVSRNLCNDGSMENANIGGWAQGDAATTHAKSTTESHAGTYSLKITNADASQAYVRQTITTASGEDYIFNGWLYGATTVNGASVLVDIDGGDTGITATEAGATASTWTEANFCYEVDDASTTIDLGSGSVTNTELAYWDDVTIFANLLDNGGLELTGSEILDETDFATHAEWDVTNDFDDTGGNAAYTWSANQDSYVQQIAADRVSTGTNSALYKFVYTVAASVAPDGDFSLVLETGFPNAAQTMAYTTGTHTIYFWSAADATVQPFQMLASCSTASQGTFTIDDVTCKEVCGWSSEGSATITVDTDEHAGDQEIKISTSAENKGITQSVTLVTGEWYEVTGWARATPGDTAQIVMDYGDTTTGTVGSVTDSSYTRLVHRFEATGTSGVIYCRGVASGDVVWFDDIAIVLLDDECEVTPTIDSTTVAYNQYSQKLVWSAANDGEEIMLREPVLSDSGSYITRFWTNLSGFDFTTANGTDVKMDIDGDTNLVSHSLLRLGDNGEMVRSFDLSETYFADGNDIHNADTNDISMSAWICIGDIDAAEFILDKGSNHISTGYCLDIQPDGDVYGFIEDGDGDNFSVYTTSSNIEDSKWHHIAIVIDRDNAGNCKIYFDGTSQNVSQAGTLASVGSVDNANDFRLGCRAVSGFIFSGNIADVKLYIAAGATWTGAQILAQANNPFLYDQSVVGTLTDFWPCWDNAANTTVTGYANDLTASANTSTFADTQWTEYNVAFTADQDGAHEYNIRADGAGAGENDATVYLDQFELRQNLVSGGWCEASDGNGLPPGWSDKGSPDAGETQTDTDFYHSGSSSIYLASAEDTEGVTQSITVADASYYTITFFAKNNNADVDVTLGTAATATIDATTSTNTWTKIEYTFLTSDTTLVVSAVSGAASQSGWFDDFSLVKLDTADATSASRTLDYLDGKIDDIRIWNRELSEGEARWLQREPYAPVK